jgi:hypothetical protein
MANTERNTERNSERNAENVSEKNTHGEHMRAYATKAPGRRRR